LFANYPETADTEGKKSSDRVVGKKKGKGKQREDVLQGLLRIDESVEPPTADPIRNQDAQNTNPSVAGPSTTLSPNVNEPQGGFSLLENGLVRIDMRQMLQLKEMGYEAMGPVNGPNEGYPEYEVSTSVFNMLNSHTDSQNAPNPNEAPMQPDLMEREQNPIDPSLLRQDSEQIGQQMETSLPKEVQMPPSTDSTTNPPMRNISPTRPLNDNPCDEAGSVAKTTGTLNKTAKKKVGKKKKITDDDLAALEAQKMVQSGSKRRSKPTQRK